MEIRETLELNRVKVRLGVPHALASCHTAEIQGYVIEGHVPAIAIRRLLDEKPKASGCQSAPKFDPVSASNFDPFERRVLAVALAPSELVGVAETVRARVGA